MLYVNVSLKGILRLLEIIICAYYDIFWYKKYGKMCTLLTRVLVLGMDKNRHNNVSENVQNWTRLLHFIATSNAYLLIIFINHYSVMENI